LIANFNQVELRQDVGALWENFVISERMKTLHYKQKWVNSWYWRTKEQKEIDCIEEQNGKLTAYEFKWNPKAKTKIPKLFLEIYKGSQFQIIHRENIEDFLL
jgi:predicted AAA+ superfamily ATPase